MMPRGQLYNIAQRLIADFPGVFLSVDPHCPADRITMDLLWISRNEPDAPIEGELIAVSRGLGAPWRIAHIIAYSALNVNWETTWCVKGKRAAVLSAASKHIRQWLTGRAPFKWRKLETDTQTACIVWRRATQAGRG